MMKRTLLLCALFLTSQACFGAGSSEVFAQINGTQPIVSTQFSDDGKRLFTLEREGAQIKVWDSASGRQLSTLKLKQAIPFSPFAPIRVSRDAKWLTYVDIRPGWSGISAHIESLEDPQLYRDFDQAMSVAIAPDSPRLYVGFVNRVEVFSLPDFKLLNTFQTDRAKRSYVARISPDGRRLLLAGEGLSVLDAQTGEELLHRDIGNTTRHPVFSPDSRYLASGCEKLPLSFSSCKASIYVIDLSGQTPDIKLGDGKDVISALSFSADAHSLFSAMRNTGEVQQFSLPDGKVLASWPASGSSKFGAVQDLAVSPQGLIAMPEGSKLRLLAVQGAGQVISAQTAQSSQALSPTELKDVPKDISVSRNGLALARYGGGGIIAMADSAIIWDLQKGRRLFSLTAPNDLTQVTLSPDGQLVYIERTTAPAGIEVWNTQSRKLERSIKIDESRFAQYKLLLSPDGKRLFSGSNDGRISIWDTQSTQLIEEFRGFKVSALSSFLAPSSNTVVDLMFSADGQRLLARNQPLGLKLFDMSRAEHPAIWTLDKGQFDKVQIQAATLSPDGRILAYSERNFSMPPQHTVTLIQVSDGKTLATLRSDDKTQTSYISALLFTPDGRQLIMGSSDGYLTRYDLARQQLGPRQPAHQGGIVGLAWQDSPASLLSSAQDGAVKVWRAESAEPLATLLKRDKEWLVLTDAGYFNASSVTAADQVNVVRQDKVYSMTAFWDVFQRPDIVGARLRGEDVSSLSGTLSIDYALRNPPPAVRITEAPGRSDQARVRVRYQIDDQGGGIAEVRVFQNGKLVRSDGVFRDAGSRTLMPVAAPSDKAVAAAARQLGGRGASQAASLQPREVAVKNCNPCSGELEVELLPGEKNEIHVIAFNRDNTIQSVAGQATIESSAPRRTPKLWLLAVGLNKFQNVPGLVNARKDAIDFACKYLGGEAFRSHAHGQSCAESGRAGSLYGEREIELVDLLLDQDAGRDRILAGLAQVAERAMPGDTFVWFVASHGLLDGNGLFGIVPFDARCLDANCERVSQLITSNDILKASAAIRAMRQVMILDTCYSGGLDTKLSGLYDARITMLARNMGLHLMASAAATEVAQDGDPGSNGLFTGQLLAALADARADSNGDHRISVVELGNYAKQQTEQLSLARGQAQTPLIQHFGEDLPLVRLQ